ncbi:MAG: SDR family oxidoreductase [Isosphaeraceae bacterium]|nr:SDR family oxidoreductase [Isosphaeraceae bacterium]
MPRAIADAVIVITGASSGIGRASALEFARRGATVVLAARRAQALEDVARECEERGGHALAVPTDVTDAEAVETLARRAIETFGRIDIWVNNAAVTLFGRIEETPLEDYRRVIETNLFGYVHGARAAIPYFREQGSGVLINVASIVGKIGQPYTSAYVATKFAILGLSECLRQELLDAPDIHVCAILPPSIDTPIFQHAANYTGRAIQPMPPVYDAQTVARAIVEAAESPRREVVIGGIGRRLLLMHTLAPGYAERRMAQKVERRHLQDRPAEPSSGNLFEPMPQYAQISGGWQALNRGPSPLGIAAAALAVIGLGLAAWRWAQPNGPAGRAIAQMGLGG